VKTSHRTLAATTTIKVNTTAIKSLSAFRREKYNPPPESSNGAPKKSRISQADGTPSDGVSGAISPNPNTTTDTNAAEKRATALTDSFMVLAVQQIMCRTKYSGLLSAYYRFTHSNVYEVREILPQNSIHSPFTFTLLNS
jgi:hypothetical protein